MSMAAVPIAVIPVFLVVTTVALMVSRFMTLAATAGARNADHDLSENQHRQG